MGLEAPIDLKEAGISQREALLTICDRAEVWRAPDGETYATVARNGHLEHHSVQSRPFRDWMLSEVARTFCVKGRPASVGENAIKEARLALEARSFTTGNLHQAAVRVAAHGEAIYIDRGTDDWTLLRIGEGNVRVVARAPVPIVRTRRTAAFPELAAKGSLNGLRQLLARLSDGDFVLLISWCLGAMSPLGPYPILIVSGEAGSGKSTFVRLVQRLVDPVIGDVLQPPADDRDLIAAARNGRVLAFDNLSKVSGELADSLCRLATGSEIGGRALFTNHETASFTACRPIILNGIPDLAARGDLADRSIVIRLATLDRYVTERDWEREAASVLPVAFTGLLEAFAWGQTRLAEVQTPNIRMADFARLAVAAEPALPCKPGSFLAAYSANKRDSTVALVEGDLVATSLIGFSNRHPDGWSGLKSQLYAVLSESISLEAKRSGDWPANPRWFADRMQRAAPSLRAVGILINERRDAQGVKVSIGKIATSAAQQSDAANLVARKHAPDAASAAANPFPETTVESGWSERL
jgi:hypothetical protein